jgi:DNA primase small subunit
MPHSTTPESSSAETPSGTALQVDNIKPEPTTQDATMEDASSPVAAEKTRVDLEELFDDDDSDGEFTSSAPVKSEEEASQPAPMYAATPFVIAADTDSPQQGDQQIVVL